MSIKAVIKDWLPPVIVRALRPLRRRGIRFEGNYASWQEAANQCTGYDAELILTKVLEATLKVKRGEAAYERDSVLFTEIEYRWPVIGALMWVAAQNSGRLDVLDFGGALGSTYFQSRAFLANLPQVRWSIIEQTHYVKAGREYIQDETLRFYPTIAGCLAENKPNVVLLSSVLQYLSESESVIKGISDSDATIIIIDRTPFNDGKDDLICVQRVPESIYKASYPMKIFSLDRFISGLVDWNVVAELPSLEGSLISSTGLAVNFQGFILRRKSCR
jgi:putative methyltransferase (TIGR04325 family)